MRLSSVCERVVQFASLQHVRPQSVEIILGEPGSSQRQQDGIFENEMPPRGPREVTHRLSELI